MSRRRMGKTRPLSAMMMLLRLAKCRYSIFMIFLLVFALSSCAGGKVVEENAETAHYISFSADGTNLAFDRLDSDQRHKIHVYDLKSGELAAYNSPLNERWTMPHYSGDGTKIVFSIMPRGEKYFQLDKMQLAIMDPGANHVRKITESSGPKIYASFSHSGGEILYVKAAKVLDKGRTPAAYFDIYELELKTGLERKLTDIACFEIYRPFYYADDKTIIFGADGITRFPDAKDPEDFHEWKELTNIHRKKYLTNTIYLITDDAAKGLKPYFLFYERSRQPVLSSDGKRLFFVAAKEPETGRGEAIYEYSATGQHRRVSNLPEFSTVWSYAASPQGDDLAVIYSDERGRWLVMIGTDGKRYKQIILPKHPTKRIDVKP